MYLLIRHLQKHRWGSYDSDVLQMSEGVILKQMQSQQINY